MALARADWLRSRLRTIDTRSQLGREPEIRVSRIVRASCARCFIAPLPRSRHVRSEQICQRKIVSRLAPFIAEARFACRDESAAALDKPPHRRYLLVRYRTEVGQNEQREFFSIAFNV